LVIYKIWEGRKIIFSPEQNSYLAVNTCRVIKQGGAYGCKEKSQEKKEKVGPFCSGVAVVK
jgi:hypothetical protein